MRGANEVLSLDSLKSIFSGLETEIQQSISGKNISEIIRKKENIRIGSTAPDFKATDLNLQPVTLSQFKGSVVLLDFWASWCVPCRESVPHLKTLYEKYHSKGLEIIAVSQDYERKPWTDAVKQDSTDMWYHILIAEKWPCRPSQLTNDDIYQNYFVQAIPATLIIDKNGKILYRHVGYSKESEETMDKQLSELF
jgi:peroxiredoxin